MTMIAKCIKVSTATTLSVIIIYKEGKFVKYILLASLIFATYFNCVALDYLFLLKKTMDIFDERFSDANFFLLPGSRLSVQFIQNMY